MQVLDQVRSAFLKHSPLHPTSTFFRDRVGGLNGHAQQPAIIHAISTIHPSQTASATGFAMDAIKLIYQHTSPKCIRSGRQNPDSLDRHPAASISGCTAQSEKPNGPKSSCSLAGHEITSRAVENHINSFSVTKNNCRRIGVAKTGVEIAAVTSLYSFRVLASICMTMCNL